VLYWKQISAKWGGQPMSQSEFEIVISPQGQVQIEVKGVQGNTCTDLTRFLEEALGEIETREFKAEYYVQSTDNTSIQHKQY